MKEEQLMRREHQFSWWYRPFIGYVARAQGLGAGESCSLCRLDSSVGIHLVLSHWSNQT